jgi:preprotein translocase subunit SecG
MATTNKDLLKYGIIIFIVLIVIGFIIALLITKCFGSSLSNFSGSSSSGSGSSGS